jgi:hypothetical protein
MRKKDIKGIAHDLINYRRDFNPVANKIFLIPRLEVNLITGEIFYPEEDDVYEFYKSKLDWFLRRISTLGGDVKHFNLAKIVVEGSREKVFIMYRGEKFEEEIVW